MNKRAKIDSMAGTITDDELNQAMAIPSYLQGLSVGPAAAEYDVLEGINELASVPNPWLERAIQRQCKSIRHCDSDLNVDMHVLAACLGHVSPNILALGPNWQNHVIATWLSTYGLFGAERGDQKRLEELRRIVDGMPGNADHNRVRELDGKAPVTPRQVLLKYRRRCLFAGVMVEVAQEPRIKKSWQGSLYPPAELLGLDQEPEALQWRKKLTLKGAQVLLDQPEFMRCVPEEISGVKL